jgi:hypothetical protein
MISRDRITTSRESAVDRMALRPSRVFSILCDGRRRRRRRRRKRERERDKEGERERKREKEREES